MSKKKDTEKALSLLRDQIDDDKLEPKDRQAAAKAVLQYFKQSVRTEKYEGKGAKDNRKNSAVAAAERLTRVK